MKKLIVMLILIFIIIMASTVLYAADRVSLGFLYGIDNQTHLVSRTNGAINQVSPTWFDISSKGDLLVSSDIDEEFIKTMKEMNVKITPFLSNHWSRSKGRAALKNSENLAEQIVNVIMKYDLDGVNVDIENLTSKDKNDFSDFINILRDKLPKEKMLTISVAANPNGIDTGWQGAYDYEKLGEYADYLFVMTYDEHSQGGECGPVASIDFVENSIKYALEKVSKDKIVIGIPLYGRFWGGDGKRDGEAVVIGDVPRIMSKFNGTATYDEESAQTCLKFNIEENQPSTKVNGVQLEAGEYTIWYENKESIIAKLELVNKYDLLGAGVWALGQEKVDVWEYYNAELNKIPYEREKKLVKEDIYLSFFEEQREIKQKLEIAMLSVEKINNLESKKIIFYQNTKEDEVFRREKMLYIPMFGKLLLKEDEKRKIKC